MLRLSAVLVAALLLPVAGQAFAGACDPGPPTGAEPPVVTHLRSYPWAFRAPTRLALAADSSLLVSDPGSARVVTRDAEGRITGKRRIGSNPISLAVDAQKRIYVGDGDIGRVRVFSRNWEFLYDLGSGSGEFALPGAIATDTASGRIYVADSPNHRVRVFNADGGSAFSFGAFGVGAGLFKYPAGLFVDAAEAELYVVDQLNFQVQVFDLDGGYLRCIGGTDANPGSVFGRQRPLNQPQGVWIDAGGRVFVSDAADGRIKVFDRSGNALAVIGEFGSIPGAMRIPTDLVIDAHNRLFVASANNARLEVYGIDGYEDIERIAPGVVEIEPATLDRNALPGQFSAIVELPGYRLDAILADTLRLNGIPALSVEAGDVDRDTAPDLLARFDAAALAATLPVSGPGRLLARAQLRNGFEFEADAGILVLSRDTDADRDGVDDALDLCPATAVSEPVDAQGCSTVQQCPCSGDAATGWRNHGEYLLCIVRASTTIGRHNDLPRAQWQTLVPDAARSSCGRPGGNSSGRRK